jgi:adenylate cyclase
MDCAALIQHIVQTATASDDGDGLLASLCDLMLEADLPVWRVSASMPALDAMASGFTMTWTRDAGVLLFHTTHGDYPKAFLESPIRALLDQDQLFGRWHLAEGGANAPYPVLAEFAAQGATDYVLHIVPFAPGTALRGVALSFATQRPGGFGPDHLTALASLVPVLGLAMAKLALAHTLRRTLGIYVGSATSEQVLGGRITRGEGRTIWAAIVLVDLRGFTTLTDRSAATDVVTWLDEHLEVLGEPVLDRGGEILKFLGDGFLAVFPVPAPDVRPCLDCGKALGAAVAARDANRALNDRRVLAGLPTLEADIVLHFGELVYGNVGTRRRLDFTVIGRAVNEASRLEKACHALGRGLLLSDTFAERCEHATVPVGVVRLAGLERAQRVWGLPDDAADTSIATEAAPL